MSNRWEYATVELMNSYGLQWRYNGDKIHQWKDKPMHGILEDLGHAGWELIAYDGTQYIFKRPFREGAPAHPVHDPAAVSTEAQ
jgi:hypothetical protein